MDQNLTMIQFFHWYYPADGSLWKRYKEASKQLAHWGINMAWLPPATKTDEGTEGVGYQPYDLFDLGEFDQKGSIRTKYGTKDEFIGAVQAAKQNGIISLADAVLNHKSGADEAEPVMACKVNPDNRTEEICEPYEIEAFTKFTFPGRGTQYSDFIWDHCCFTGVDFDNRTQETAIFSLRNPHGADWDEVITDEKGNYDYLMYADIEFRNPSVRNELKWWGEWMTQTTGVEGYRLDAIKHMSVNFINDWIDHLRNKSGINLFFVGEFWENDAAKLDAYIRASEGRLHLFDAPLHYKFFMASNDGNNFDMRQIFDDTLAKINPLRCVTVVENHDSQPLQGLESPVEHWFKPIAYALMLLRREGIPCVFYADLYGASYKDYGADGNEHEIFLEKVQELPVLLLCRKLLAYGDQYDYFDHDTCIGFTRTGSTDKAQSGFAVVLSNGDKGQKTMEMGQRYAGKRFVDALGKCPQEVVINKAGWGEFFCEGGSVSVWVDKDALDKLK